MPPDPPQPIRGVLHTPSPRGLLFLPCSITLGTAFAFQGYPGAKGLPGPQGPQGPYVSISLGFWGAGCSLLDPTV